MAVALIVCSALGIQGNFQIAVATSPELIESNCNDVVSSPDFTVRLAFPTSIPPEQYDEVQSKVLQRVNLFALDACSVQRADDDTIVIQLAVNSYFRMPKDEIENILSRRGLVQIIDPNGLHFDEGMHVDVTIVAARSSPVPTPPTYIVLATNDDIVQAFALGMPDSSNGVVFRLSGAGSELFSLFSRENVGNEFAIMADGNIILTSTIDEVIEPGTDIGISGLELEEANSLAFYLGSDAYPAVLCVAELANSAMQSPEREDQCRET